MTLVVQREASPTHHVLRKIKRMGENGTGLAETSLGERRFFFVAFCLFSF